jgi:hypothetical protein
MKDRTSTYAVDGHAVDQIRLTGNLLGAYGAREKAEGVRLHVRKPERQPTSTPMLQGSPTGESAIGLSGSSRSPLRKRTTAESVPRSTKITRSEGARNLGIFDVSFLIRIGCRHYPFGVSAITFRDKIMRRNKKLEQDSDSIRTSFALVFLAPVPTSL